LTRNFFAPPFRFGIFRPTPARTRNGFPGLSGFIPIASSGIGEEIIGGKGPDRSKRPTTWFVPLKGRYGFSGCGKAGLGAPCFLVKKRKCEEILMRLPRL